MEHIAASIAKGYLHGDLDDSGPMSLHSTLDAKVS
jgi:hypothetical protein